jgi:hypothetical protein
VTSAPQAVTVRRSVSIDDGPGGAPYWAEWDGERWAATDAPEFKVHVPETTEWLRLRCRSRHHRATKLWTWDGEAWSKTSEDLGLEFEVDEIWTEDTLEAWLALFENWREPSELLVRGILARRTVGVIRRGMSAGVGAWLAPHPIGRRVIVCDFDGLEADVLVPGWPGSTRWPTPDEGAALVRAAINRALPARFWGAGAVYRWSASTGVPGGSRGPCGWSRPSCHAVLIVDRPIADASLRGWFRSPDRGRRTDGTAMVDHAVAGSVQPLFVAPPIFTGAPSPWRGGMPRVGRLAGHEVTEAPAELLGGAELRRAQAEKLEAERVQQAQALALARAERTRRVIVGAVDPDGIEAERLLDEERRQRFGRAARARAAEKVLGAGVGDRHPTLIAQAYHLGTFVGGGVIDETEARQALTQAWSAVANGRDDGPRTIEAGLRDGARSPRTWDDVKAEGGA